MNTTNYTHEELVYGTQMIDIFDNKFAYRRGPVPRTRKNQCYGKYRRSPKTFNSIKAEMSYGRPWKHIPTRWSDQKRCIQRSWKSHRGEQYKIIEYKA